MFCNIKEETQNLRKSSKCDILMLQNDKAYIKVKDKNNNFISNWVSKKQLENFRYFAWYNGIKEEFQAAKKLAKTGTYIYNLTGQDWHIVGKFEITDIKKLLNQMLPYADYFKKRETHYRY